MIRGSTLEWKDKACKYQALQRRVVFSGVFVLFYCKCNNFRKDYYESKKRIGKYVNPFRLGSVTVIIATEAYRDIVEASTDKFAITEIFHKFGVLKIIYKHVCKYRFFRNFYNITRNSKRLNVISMEEYTERLVHCA